VNAIDRDNPATTSEAVIRDIIRGRIGFDGLLMSDDVSMNALSGDYSSRAASIYAAGCDLVLHCSGRTEEMREIGGAAPALGGKSRERATRALQARHDPEPLDEDAAREEYRALVARTGWAAS
jgi:beta-N-acetylhexosaminidase